MEQHKILLVDDDPYVLASLSRQFHNDYAVFTAQSGLQALQEMKKDGPFSLMITDYHMPSMSGIELVIQMHKVEPDTINVLLTGNADVEMAVNAINEGHLFRFLLKPCPKETILQTVEAGIKQYE